jgi:hypothetical protein
MYVFYMHYIVVKEGKDFNVNDVPEVSSRLRATLQLLRVLLLAFLVRYFFVHRLIGKMSRGFVLDFFCRHA